MAKLTISLNENVREVLQESAKRYGVSMSAYISQLIMKTDVEYQMSKLLKVMDPEQLQKAIEETMRGG